MATLSQPDMDNLVAILGQETAPKDLPRSSKRLRVYDFRRPDKFSKDALRVLQFLHENFARALTTFLSGQLRSMATVFASSVDQMTFEEYCRLLPNPCVVSMIKVPPLPSTAFLELHPNLAFPIIDRLFGGPGRQSDRVRTLTEIEQTVVRGLMDGILRLLAESWLKVEKVRPLVQAVETNPLFVQILAPNETVVVITFEVKLGNHTGPLNLVLPHLLMEPILPSLSAHQWFGVVAPSDEATGDKRLTNSLAQVQIGLSVLLGRCQLTVRELLSLESGDVVAVGTPADGDVTILVGEEAKFKGKVGRQGKRLAVQITRILEGVNADG